MRFSLLTALPFTPPTASSVGSLLKISEDGIEAAVACGAIDEEAR